MQSFNYYRLNCIIILSAIFLSYLTIHPLFAQSEFKKLHSNALVADLHCDALYTQKEGHNIETEQKFGQFDLMQMRTGGVDVQFFAVWPNPRDIQIQGYFDQAVAMIDSFYEIINRHQDIMQPARSPQEIINIIASGKTAACLGLEGGAALDNDLNNINYFYDRGVRYIGLTWNNSTIWASSARDESSSYRKGKKGLGAFGRLVVKRMNELGMMIDLSHAGEQTFYDVLKISTKPVIASHSSVYSICPHYRNLKDDQIKALAHNGGVIFINFYPGYLVKGFDQVYRHKKIMVTNPGDAASKCRATINGHIFTNNIMIPNTDFGGFILILQMLWRGPDGHKRKKPATPANFRMPLHIHVRHQFSLVSYRGMFAHNTIGPNDDIFS